jgi:exodeoxyribonuclease VII small subunit
LGRAIHHRPGERRCRPPPLRPHRSTQLAMAEESGPRFEDALARIERIVEDLERGEPALSTALAKFEEGIQLVRSCYDLLEQAERSVALLTGVDEQGHPATAPFDATATAAREPESITPDPAGNVAKPRTRATASDPSRATDLPF